MFEVEGLIHPCLAITCKDFIRNNIILEDNQDTFLITGPNMGGKSTSTLMRSVCIATIMAQMGSFVPAYSFRLSPRDRVFTRIGASDNIFEGKSTFYIELEETYNIVNEATQDSLVIMDELGRGTSTYDGMSIAYAVLKHLSTRVECLTFFATHYHLLVEEFELFRNFGMYYMECQVIEEEVVKFLYKFRKGSIGNSFGLSVAKIAGLNSRIIQKAKEKADFITGELLNVGQFTKLSSRFDKTLSLLSAVEDETYHEDELFNLLTELCKF